MDHHGGLIGTKCCHWPDNRSERFSILPKESSSWTAGIPRNWAKLFYLLSETLPMVDWRESRMECNEFNCLGTSVEKC